MHLQGAGGPARAAAAMAWRRQSGRRPLSSTPSCSPLVAVVRVATVVTVDVRQRRSSSVPAITTTITPSASQSAFAPGPPPAEASPVACPGILGDHDPAEPDPSAADLGVTPG